MLGPAMGWRGEDTALRGLRGDCLLAALCLLEDVSRASAFVRGDLPCPEVAPLLNRFELMELWLMSCVNVVSERSRTSGAFTALVGNSLVDRPRASVVSSTRGGARLRLLDGVQLLTLEGSGLVCVTQDGAEFVSNIEIFRSIVSFFPLHIRTL